MPEFTPRDRITQAVTVRCPGALPDVVLMELWHVMDEFLQNTNVWQHDVDLVTPQGNGFALTIPAGTKAVRVVGANRTVDGWMTMDRTGYEFRNGPDPGMAPTTVTVALSVADPTDYGDWPNVPDWVYAHYSQALINGLLARMLSQPAKPYSNPQMAVFHGRSFNKAMGEARSHNRQRGVQGAQTWRFPQAFARVR